VSSEHADFCSFFAVCFESDLRGVGAKDILQEFQGGHSVSEHGKAVFDEENGKNF
jgi:hypothetical protein